MRDTEGCFSTIIPSKSRKGLILLLHYECPLWRQPLAQCVKLLLPPGSSFLSTDFLLIRKPKYSCRSIYVSASPPQNSPVTYDTRDAIKKAFHSLFHAELSFQTHNNRSMFTFRPSDLIAYNISTVSDVPSVLVQQLLLYKNQNL